MPTWPPVARAPTLSQTQDHKRRKNSKMKSRRWLPSLLRVQIKAASAMSAGTQVSTALCYLVRTRVKVCEGC